MLERISTLAQRLRPLARPLATISALLLAAVVVLVLTTASERADRWMLAALSGFLWTGCGVLFIHAFAEVPAPPAPTLGAFARLKVRLNRALHWLLLLVFVGLTLGVLSLTGRLLEEFAYFA